MFGRLTSIKLKTAEQAMQDGRIDEALDAAASPELAGHRRARQILAELFEPIMNRAQDHLLGGRFRDALLDLEKAARCGVAPDKVHEWRARALSAMEQANQRENHQRQAVDAAANRLALGALTSAGQQIERLPDRLPIKAQLLDEVTLRMERARQSLRDADTAIRSGQLAAAVDSLVAARRDHAGSTEVRDMGAFLLKKLDDRAREALTAGQLDRAKHDAQLARRIDAGAPELAELDRALKWADESCTAIRDGRYDAASALMSKFTQLIPDARWASDVKHHLQKMGEHLSALAEGPLGLLHSGPGIAGERPARRCGSETLTGEGRRASSPAPAAPRPVPPKVEAGGLPRRLLLRIDGVGSFLLIRSERITIGRPGAAADLPIISDLAERHAEIHRTGDDYFIVGTSGVEVAGTPVRQALLSAGDRIQLGRRVRMTFDRPSRKSPAAVLSLAEGVRSVADVRRIVLCNGPLLIGPTTDCHIPLRGGMPGIVLVERAGSLQLRALPGASAGGMLSGPMPLALGESVEVAGMRLSVSAFNESSGVGRTT